MKVLLKSLKELNVIERRDGYLIVDGTILCNDMINLLGKVHEARYDKDYDSYIIDEYDFDSSIIKKKDYYIYNRYNLYSKGRIF